MLKKSLEWVIPLTLAGLIAGCGLRLQKAIDSLDSWANKNPEENE